MERHQIIDTPETRQRRLDQRTKMIEDLAASGTVDGIAIGEIAPQFVLPNQRGALVSLADRLSQGPVVVAFDRGSWCPICNAHIRSLQQILSEITELGGMLLAISPQKREFGQQFADDLELGFDVLSDQRQDAIRAYRLQFRLPDELAAHSAELGHPIDGQNADGSLDLPVPATFVIDTAGVVRARHVDPNYRHRMEPGVVLDALRVIAKG